MKIPVMLIDEIVNSATTEDGSHVVLTTRDVDGTNISVGLTHEQVPRLIDLSTRALTECQELQHMDWNPTAAAEVTWWNLNRSTAGGFLLTLTFGSGGRLSFGISTQMASALLVSLNSYMDTEAATSNGLPGFVE